MQEDPYFETDFFHGLRELWSKRQPKTYLDFKQALNNIGNAREIIVGCKLKFECEDCERSWTSANGTCAFNYLLRRGRDLIVMNTIIYR